MPSAPSGLSPRFRGIDPAGLEALDRCCRTLGDALSDAGRECVAAGAHLDEDVVMGIGRRLVAIGQRVVAAAAELAERAAAMESAQRTSVGFMRSRFSDLSATLRAHVDRVGAGALIGSWRNDPIGAVGSLRELALEDRARVLADLGPAEVFTWVDHLIVGTTGVGADAAVSEMAAALQGDDLLALVRMLSAAGHDDRVVAGVVDGLAGSSPRRLADVARAALHAHEEGYRVGATVLGRLLVVAGAPAATVVARVTAGSPNTLSVALYRAAAADPSSDPAGAIAAMTAALVAIDDTSLRTLVALDLMEATAARSGEPWRRSLDGIITRLLVADPPGSLALLTAGFDPAGDRVVPWLRRLFVSDEGPVHLGHLIGAAAPWIDGHEVDAVRDDAIERGRVSGYLAGSLTMAARLEADEARRIIGDLGGVAGRLELILSALAALPSAAGIVVPGSLDLGVAGATARAGDRTEKAVWRLVDWIDRRFEPRAGSFGPELGEALDAFDDARRAVVDQWSG